MAAFLAAALSLGAAANLTAQDAPLFPDAKLEAVVRQYVFAKRDNTEPLTADDVKNISTIEGKDKGIRDLRGLEKCTSLALLDLEANDIADLDPIAGLVNIQSWGRDLGDPFGSSLSNALEIVVCP